MVVCECACVHWGPSSPNVSPHSTFTTLSLSSFPTFSSLQTRYLVCWVSREGLLPSCPAAAAPKFGGYLTPLILLGYAVKFAAADAAADLDFHERNLSQDCVGYGVKGKVNSTTHLLTS